MCRAGEEGGRGSDSVAEAEVMNYEIQYRERNDITGKTGSIAIPLARQRYNRSFFFTRKTCRMPLFFSSSSSF